MSYETIKYSVKDRVAVVAFNRPHRLNAVVEQLYNEVLDALSVAEADRSVSVIVLTGEGRAFCVGADLKEHKSGERTLNDKRNYLKLEQVVCDRIYRSSKPVIAAVNGYALGAGAEMAVAADFIFMKETAQIGFPEAGIGTFIGGGATYILPRIIGVQKAKELFLTAQKIDGKKALEIGLLTDCFADDVFEDGVWAFAAKLAANAPISMRLAKMHLNEPASFTVSLEREVESLMHVVQTKDWQEGVDAFAEKRKPTFKGE
ncbi:MAG: enoyl-CoA hydratase/isomerase family protein [Alphaproteobacteria bacterium]